MLHIICTQIANKLPCRMFTMCKPILFYFFQFNIFIYIEAFISSDNI